MLCFCGTLRRSERFALGALDSRSWPPKLLPGKVRRPLCLLGAAACPPLPPPPAHPPPRRTPRPVCARTAAAYSQLSRPPLQRRSALRPAVPLRSRRPRAKRRWSTSVYAPMQKQTAAAWSCARTPPPSPRAPAGAARPRRAWLRPWPPSGRRAGECSRGRGAAPRDRAWCRRRLPSP